MKDIQYANGVKEPNILTFSFEDKWRWNAFFLNLEWKIMMFNSQNHVSS